MHKGRRLFLHKCLSQYVVFLKIYDLGSRVISSHFPSIDPNCYDPSIVPFSYVFGNLLSLIIYRDPSRYKRSTRLHSNGGWWHNTLLPGDRETYSCVWMVGPKHVLKSSMCHSLDIHWDIFHWDIFHEYFKISVCNLYFSYPPFSTRDDKSSYHRQR